jgi:hypothetical protein
MAHCKYSREGIVDVQGMSNMQALLALFTKKQKLSRMAN